MIDSVARFFEVLFILFLQLLGFIYHWYIWVFVHVLSYMFVSQKWVLEDLGLKKWLGRYFLLSILSTVLYVALQYSLVTLSLFPTSRYILNSPEQYYFQLVASAYSTFWGTIGLMLIIEYYKKYEVKRKDALELKAELAETNLKLLKMQLQPHFVFNTLNTVVSLIYEKPSAAENMIVYLSDFLRKTLALSEKNLISIEDEINVLKDYLSIAEIRYEDQLYVSYNISKRALRTKVPFLILQPLVENAIVHNIYTKEDRLELDIAVFEEENGISITVINTYTKGLDKRKSTGLGIKTTEERLQHFYGEKMRLTYGQFGKNTFKVEIFIPYQVRQVRD